MKKKIGFALILAAFIVACGAGKAQAGMTGCFGPPSDYTAKFDQVRGQSKNGQVDYPYPTVFLDFQGWLTPNDGVAVPGHHSEHLHTGACVPLNITLNDTNAPVRYLDVRQVMHNVLHYTVISVAGAIIDQSSSAAGIQATQAQVAELNSAAAASASTTVNVYQSYKLAAPTSNGLKEMRWGLRVVRNSPDALVDEWKTSGRWYFTQNYAGLPLHTALGAPDLHIDFVRTQNWIQYRDEAGVVRTSYGYAGFGDSQLSQPSSANWTPTKMKVAVPGSWTTSIRTTDGTNRAAFYVDPNFHEHPDTYVWTHSVMPQGDETIPVTIPVSSFGFPSLSVHRLLVQGHKWPGVPSNKPISTSIVVRPFRAP